jgi:hypothetical protein
MMAAAGPDETIRLTPPPRPRRFGAPRASGLRRFGSRAEDGRRVLDGEMVDGQGSDLDVGVYFAPGRRRGDPTRSETCNL